MHRAPPNSDSLPNTPKAFLMQSFRPTPSFCKNHFSLQLFLNSLNSSGAEPERAQPLSRTGTMIASRIACRAGMAGLLMLAALSAPTRASNLTLPPETTAILDKIYSFDLDGAIEGAKRIEQEQPKHPLGYLLEAEALWWRIWCTSVDFKYGMSDARRRPKLEADRHYIELSARALSLAETQIKQSESAEMQFYAGMAEASSARLYGLRAENRNAARSGVRAREHLLRAKALDPDLADADMGLGLYNYYVDTLSAIARILRFFMGIPGGSKQDGVRLLEHAMAQGVVTPTVARFYLALNLHRYDQQYEKALSILGPLVEKYPANPLFQLARGDLYAKLGRKQQALACYRAASSLTVRNSECHTRIQNLARASIAALAL
jgi:tetratricopeptide (TPR) repeat protein